MTQNSTQRYLAIDLLRGLAALAVLIFHYQALYWTAPVTPVWSSVSEQPWYSALRPIYGYGGYAVQLFWTISGFVFSATYLSKRHTMRQFAVARFARLYPLHFATLLIVAAIQIVSMHVLGGFQVYPYNDLFHFILNVFFASSWGLQKGFSFNAPIWSVSVEVVIYCVFWVSVPIIARFPVIGSVTVMIAAYFIHPHLSKVQFWYCAYYFYLGVLLFRIVTLLDRWSLAVGVALLCLWCVVGFGKVDTFLPWQIPLLFGAIVVIMASIDKRNVSPDALRKLSWIGDSTYATYLLHMPIIMTLDVLFKYFKINRVIFLDRPWALISFLGVTFALARLCFLIFERPAQNYLRRAFDAGGVPALRTISK